MPPDPGAVIPDVSYRGSIFRKKHQPGFPINDVGNDVVGLKGAVVVFGELLNRSDFEFRGIVRSKE